MTKFTWDKLLCDKRLSSLGNNSINKNKEENKVSFDSDYKKILTSPAFRRLQDKTQVFPLERNDFVHTRLTHSMEVAMIARELAMRICDYKYKKDELTSYKEQICRIVESASLLHDIGNPPFGHFGEDIIREWFSHKFEECLRKVNTEREKNKLDKLAIDNYLSDLKNFEGNAQALRIVTKLHNFFGNHGMDLTVGTLNTIIKYTRNSTESDNQKTGKIVDKKIGYFLSEQDIFNKITTETEVGHSRHPLTFILEAADDIAYLTADIEDSFEKGVTDFDKFKNFLTSFCETCQLNSTHLEELIKKDIADKNKEHRNVIFSKIRQYMIDAAKFSFTNNYTSIMNGDFNQDLFKGSHSEGLHEALSQFSRKHIFNDKNILKLEVSGHTILTFLLDKFIPAVIPPKPVSKLDKKLWALIAKKHVKVYEECKENITDDNELLYHRILMVTDFISGMTDSYAHDLYLILSGNEI